ncbi:MAG TPA: NADAR family protein, partial [Hyphomonadaceae bacterium]|nr:NADAR family protein [Hyphomonadaceae bacterium]
LLFFRGPFSQFHPSNFTLDDRAYVCAEQYMHAEKARLFGDVAMAERIMTSHSPHEHKLMGGAVAGFDQDEWDSHKIAIVTDGNRAKFAQNAGLRRRLLDTGDAILAEANPKDFIWGIGLAEDDPAALDPGNWEGENLLGEILMAVRRELGTTPSTT